MFNIIFNKTNVDILLLVSPTIILPFAKWFFSYDANNAVFYCYKGCYFPHQNIVWSNTFTKIPELNVQANILYPRIYSFKTTSTTNTRAW